MDCVRVLSRGALMGPEIGTNVRMGGAPEMIAKRLLDRLRALRGVVVAYSGGVDSTLVLAAALRALPPDRVVAAIADSPSLARAELVAARATAAGLGAELVELPSAELDVPGYRGNAGDRCYFCKFTVLSVISEFALRRGIARVATGTHADDHRAAHRPGLRAARELQVSEPLADAGLGKVEVRALAAAWSLPVADKPATPCLASRIAVGVPVSIGRLGLVERAEIAVRATLADAGLAARDLRVRLLGRDFRIELDSAAYATVADRPGLAEHLFATLDGIGLAGAGTIATYRAEQASPRR